MCRATPEQNSLYTKKKKQSNCTIKTLGNLCCQTTICSMPTSSPVACIIPAKPTEPRLFSYRAEATMHPFHHRARTDTMIRPMPQSKNLTIRLPSAHCGMITTLGVNSKIASTLALEHIAAARAHPPGPSETDHAASTEEGMPGAEMQTATR